MVLRSGPSTSLIEVDDPLRVGRVGEVTGEPSLVFIEFDLAIWISEEDSSCISVPEQSPRCKVTDGPGFPPDRASGHGEFKPISKREGFGVGGDERNVFEIKLFKLNELAKQDVFPVSAGEWGFPSINLVEALDSEPDISFVDDAEPVGLDGCAVEGTPWRARTMRDPIPGEM